MTNTAEEIATNGPAEDWPHGHSAKNQALRALLPGISSPVMRGDNLAILLASYFEPGIDDEEMDESETWKQGAIDAANEVLDAIHEHYTRIRK